MSMVMGDPSKRSQNKGQVHDGSSVRAHLKFGLFHVTTTDVWLETGTCEKNQTASVINAEPRSEARISRASWTNSTFTLSITELTGPPPSVCVCVYSV